MLNFIGLNKVKKIKKLSFTRTINDLALYDLDFVADTYKNCTMTFGGGGNATDLFKHTAFWYSPGHTEQSDGSVILKPGNSLRRTDLGIWVEQARTNAVLFSRDLTNNVWVKNNLTSSLNQIGLDNIVNSASSITAIAADATILQPIILASSQRFQSAYIKRLSGTGNIFMTMDGGLTWADVTSQVSNNWTRISLPTAIQADPQVGFKIGTAGDSFAIDFVQNENGNTISSPRQTTNTAVNSFGDRSSADDTGGTKLSPLPPLLRGSFGFCMTLSAARLEAFGPMVSSSGVQMSVNVDGSFQFGAGNSKAAITPPGQFIRGRFVVNKIAGYLHSDGTIAISCNGNPVAKVTGSSPITTLTHMDLGTNGSQLQSMHGTVKRLSFFAADVLTDDDLISFTTL